MGSVSHDKRQQVEQMFDSIAPTYDVLNHLLSLGIDRGWRRKVVKMVADDHLCILPGFRKSVPDSPKMVHLPSASSFAPRPFEQARWLSAWRRLAARKNESHFSHRLHDDFRKVGRTAQTTAPAILDVATGTGDLAIALAREIPSARITGVDISENMLEEGKRKVAEKGLGGRVVLGTGDAEKLHFPDGVFDVVTVAFGVRNFGDIEAGLRQMQRVLKPGGKCFVLEFSEPRGLFFGKIYRFYFHRVLPLAGRLVSRDKGAYSYLPRSVDGFPSPERFSEMLRRAGFSAVRARKLTFGVAWIYEAGK